MAADNLFGSIFELLPATVNGVQEPMHLSEVCAEGYDNVFAEVFKYTPCFNVYAEAYTFGYYFETTHTRGRQPIAVDQPTGGGSNYPFSRPSDDIKQLIGDLFVSFDDLDDLIEFPIRVAWMAGFGSIAVSPITGYPSQVNSHDMLLLDANDVVVFNSTHANKFTSSVWDNRLLVLEWTVDDVNILRCVKHVAWTAEDFISGQYRQYDNHIVPDNGLLSIECCYKLPKRVTSIQVGLTSFRGSSVSIQEGYNIGLTQPQTISPIDGSSINLGLTSIQKPLVVGSRKSTKVQISAEPGSGLGAFPGCVSTARDIKTINRVASNSFQNFTFDSSGCIRLQRVVSLTSAEPREFGYGALSLSSTEARAAIELHNNCKPCCDCLYFARTYQGLKRQWFLYRAIGVNAENVRDTYKNNVDRWLTQKNIRESDTLRNLIQSDGECKVSWGVAHCNASKCCLVNVTLTMTWLYYINGILQPTTIPGYDCLKTKIDGSAQCDGPENIILDKPGTTPDGRLFKVSWAYSDPQSVTTVQGRICLPDCRNLAAEDLKVKLHTVVSWENSSLNPNDGQVCNYNEISFDDLPDDVKTTWDQNGYEAPAQPIRAQKLSPLLTVTEMNRFCESCACEGSPDT